ncbi:MAG: 3-dehydroquinate synthase [Lachnospiraceae bacterium]|nr:3-dehydroquinate synthase [Lachnospiraceae bacterium]
MITVPVKTSAPYDVHIGSGILQKAGELIRPVLRGRAALITDSTVDSLYGDIVRQSLADSGFDAVSYVFPAGEEHKNLSEYAGILSFLAENAVTRGDFLIALGGGVSGDMTGFAAATYLRGIPFVQIPTTFLAAADASVGGKTAVDLAAGKNLVGAFHQPSLVICDTDTFSTLTPAAFADGMTETIKHGLICDRAFFDFLASGDRRGEINEIVRKDVEIKSSFVAADEFDRGRRQMLNFGHTIGHAVEVNSEFSVSHGRAVAIGMCAAAKAAHAFGLCGEDLSVPIREALSRYGIDSACPFSAASLTEAALRDKKRFGETINIIYLKTIGEAAVHPLPVRQLEAFLRAGCES